jgi:hypothetical protein
MPGSRYWADRTGSGRRRTYPAFRGHEYADVVVVGGGLTGCTIASVLAAGGMDVILVDAGRLATGSTEAGLGMILPSPDSSYEAVEKAAGRRVARAAWKEAQRSAREFATALRKLPNKSDVEPAPFVINARDSDDVAGLRKEQTVRKIVDVIGHAEIVGRNIIKSVEIDMSPLRFDLDRARGSPPARRGPSANRLAEARTPRAAEATPGTVSRSVVRTCIAAGKSGHLRAEFAT